jgi:hypothetical protein
LLAWKSDHPAVVREYAESEQRALVLIAHFASRLSSRHAELLDEMATHNEWVVAFENLCSIIEYDWERLTAQDLVALLEEVGADWEQPPVPNQLGEASLARRCRAKSRGPRRGRNRRLRARRPGPPTTSRRLR